MFDARLNSAACGPLFAVCLNDLLNKHEQLFVVLLFESLPGKVAPFFFGRFVISGVVCHGVPAFQSKRPKRRTKSSIYSYNDHRSAPFSRACWLALAPPTLHG